MEKAFRTVVSWKDSKPVISWELDLNEGGTRHERVYRKFGKVQLTDKNWTPIDDGDEADFNFFKVSVDMK